MSLLLLFRSSSGAPPEISGTLAATDIADTAAFTGTVAISGTLNATDGADTAAFTGTVIAPEAGFEGGWVMSRRLWWHSPPKSKRKQAKVLAKAIEQTVEAAREVDAEVAERLAQLNAKALAERMLEEDLFSDIIARSHTIGDMLQMLWREAIEQDDERIILEVLKHTIH